MTDMAHAIAIEPDAAARAFIADALATFEPGFRVATCSDLDAATRRMALQVPDIVIVRPRALDPTALAEWLGTHDVPEHRVITIGASDVRAAASIGEPVSLPSLIRVAREVTNAASKYDGPNEDITRLRAVQG